ncbi:methyltransferase family protein [Microbacterium sp. AG1240]|uniref:class I SAM-dependent methyltransferase n=1 Tax=Microbacterium sp. AG1240 TaxID=2183992 RepID=UPI000EB145E6|nr:class I SAM-dependent methyltransferase [Microbacterium sp. AG1240]RKT36140.1 methyltransferase family protein [Microbacterium sp. AG1240]
MVDDADAGGWSAVAAGWSELWADAARPAHDAIIAAAGIGPGARVLDVGCGSGEFLLTARDAGAQVTGVDPAGGMRELARNRGLDVRDADAAHLPFTDGTFDVVAAVNALHFADDTTAALREFARVLAPGGRIAVANWAEGALNDVDVIERAVAAADESDPLPDGPLRPAGGLEAAFAAAGVHPLEAGVVEAPWTAPDDETLVRGILLGEDAAALDFFRAAIVEAAAPFRTADGYVLRNAFRWAVGEV